MSSKSTARLTPAWMTCGKFARILNSRHFVGIIACTLSTKCTCSRIRHSTRCSKHWKSRRHTLSLFLRQRKSIKFPRRFSRCQHYNFRRIPRAEIVQRLRYVADQDGITVEDRSFTSIARASDGSMRDALDLLDQSVSFGGKTIRHDHLLSLLGSVPHELIRDVMDADSRSGQSHSCTGGGALIGSGPRSPSLLRRAGGTYPQSFSRIGRAGCPGVERVDRSFPGRNFSHRLGCEAMHDGSASGSVSSLFTNGRHFTNECTPPLCPRSGRDPSHSTGDGTR